jgi:hypothetical protein
MNRLFGTIAAIVLLRELIRPFDQFEAFRLGTIDRHGTLLRSPRTAEERNSYNALTRVAVNLNRLLAKVPRWTDGNRLNSRCAISGGTRMRRSRLRD